MKINWNTIEYHNVLITFNYVIFDFVNKAQKRNVFVPSDLTLLPNDQHEKLWNEYCDEYFKNK